MDRQCSSCGGFCKKSGCERENVKPKPQRTWVGLTDEEKLILLKKHFNAVSVPDWFDAFLADIEAKIKEKNS